MQENKKQKVTIGRAERVAFPLLGGAELYARIDTGAKTSSIWTLTERVDTGMRFASDDIYQQARHYDKVRVASSMGHQLRDQTADYPKGGVLSLHLHAVGSCPDRPIDTTQFIVDVGHAKEKLLAPPHYKQT